MLYTNVLIFFASVPVDELQTPHAIRLFIRPSVCLSATLADCTQTCSKSIISALTGFSGLFARKPREINPSVTQSHGLIPIDVLVPKFHPKVSVLYIFGFRLS
jgi:hypothetical protein